MKLVALNVPCKNDCIREALKRSGYKLRVKRVQWPRVRGAVRIDVSTGSKVAVLQ